jgi:hypothetical protein
MREVTSLPTNSEESDAKSFFNKPMNELTIKDTLLMQASAVLIAELIHMSLQGWVAIIRKAGRK